MENNNRDQALSQNRQPASSSLQRGGSNSNLHKRKARSKQILMQTSPQEQYERVKFQFYDFQDKLDKLMQFAMTACQTPTQNAGYNLINIREQLVELNNDFGSMQTNVLQNMENQNNLQQRQKSKNKRYKKLLKEYQTQTSIMVQDQKEFEESIKKEHDNNQGKIKSLLDRFEKQVAQKKNTINTLHEHRKENYEKLMDDAVNQIRHYFNKIEGQAQEKPGLSQREDQDSELTSASLFEPINVLRKFISGTTREGIIGSDIDDSGFDEILDKTEVSILQPVPESAQGNAQVQIQAPKSNNIQKVNIPPIPLEQIGRVPMPQGKKTDIEYAEISAIVDQEPSAEGRSFNEEEKDAVNDKTGGSILVNPLLIGVVAQKKPEWDDRLEEEDPMLSEMATERLKQFTDDYEMLMHLEDDDQRILIKNHLFEVYGKIIRKQIKKEKKAVKEKAQQKQQLKVSAEGEKKKANEFNGEAQTSVLDGLAIRSPKDASDGSIAIVNMSNISLQSALPPLKTNEAPSARDEYDQKDVNINEVFEAEMSIGLQTATQKSLIKRIDEDYNRREAEKKMLKDNEVQLDYDSFVASASRASVGNHAAKVSDRARDVVQPQNRSNFDIKDSNYNSNATDNVDKANKLIFIEESESNVSVQDMRSRRERHAFEQNDGSHQKMSHESSSVLEMNKSSKSNEKEPNSGVISGRYSKPIVMQKMSPEHIMELQPVRLEDVDLEFDSQAQYHPEQIGAAGQQDFRHQPNMEVIRERQSEFSMSILNDARAANSYRSRQSKGLSQHYENASIRQNSRKEASFKSEAHSINSTNAKKKSERMRESFDTEERAREKIQGYQKFAIKTSDKKRQQSKIARCNSQAQIHENEDLSQLEGGMGSFQKATSHARMDAKPMVTRNKASKVYKTSNSIQYTNSRDVMQTEQPGEYCNQFLHKLKAKELNNKYHRRNQDEIGTKRPSSSSLLHIDNQTAQAKQQYTQLNTERDRENLTQNFFNKQPYSHRSHFPAEPQSSRRNDSLDASPAPSKFSRPPKHAERESRKELPTKIEYEAFGSDICMGPISHVCIEGDSSVQNQFGLANNTGQYSHMNLMPSIQHTSYPSDASSRLNMIEVNFGQGAPLAHADPIVIDTGKVSQSIKPLNEQQDQISPLIDNMRNEGMSNDFTEKVQKQEDRTKFAGQRGLVRSSSECLLRDKEFYDMADDEDEVAVYCKLQEQGVLDVFYQRNLSEMQNKAIAHLKSSTNCNTQGFNAFTNDHGSLSGARIDVAKLAELSSQGKLIFMSQQTVNKMQQRAMQTQSKTFERGLISEQMAGVPLGTAGGNIFENVNENTVVDKNSSQQQTRGKATFNKMFGMKGLNQLYLANPSLNQALIGTNLLMTSFENVTQPLYNHIMVPTHQYNRKTLLMMQNLHNNYLYSANTGILFTGRGLTSGLVQGFGKKSTTIGGHNTNNGTNEQSFVVNMAGDSLSRADLQKVPFERAVKNSTQESLQQQFERNVKEGLGGMVIRENVYSQQPNEVSSISGEPINIQNFIRGAKQQSELLNINQLSQGNCISIIDDDCKMAVDRRFLQEVKNLSHQLKGRKLFSQSNSKIVAQQTSSDFSQQLTEQRFSANQPTRVELDSVDQQKQVKQRESSSSVLTRKAFSFKNNPKILQLIKDKVQAQQLNRKQANSSALVGGLGHSQSKTQLAPDYESVRNMRAQGSSTQMALHRRLADNASSQSFRKLTKLTSDEQPQSQHGVAKTKLRKVSLGRRELSENSKNYLNPTHRSDQNYSSQTSTKIANLMAGLKKISHKQQLKKMGSKNTWTIQPPRE